MFIIKWLNKIFLHLVLITLKKYREHKVYRAKVKCSTYSYRNKDEFGKYLVTSHSQGDFLLHYCFISLFFIPPPLIK